MQIEPEFRQLLVHHRRLHRHQVAARRAALVRDARSLHGLQLDRLTPSPKDLQDNVRELKERRVALRATEQPIDTGTAASKAFLDILGVFAELETNLRKEPQAEGIATAKGRKSKINSAVVPSRNITNNIISDSQLRADDTAISLTDAKAAWHQILDETLGVDDPKNLQPDD